jgi:hypothetical protein
LAFCRANPNWIPKNPKLIFHNCQKFSRGFELKEGGVTSAIFIVLIAIVGLIIV